MISLRERFLSATEWSVSYYAFCSAHSSGSSGVVWEPVAFVIDRRWGVLASFLKRKSYLKMARSFLNAQIFANNTLSRPGRDQSLDCKQRAKIPHIFTSVWQTSQTYHVNRTGVGFPNSAISRTNLGIDEPISIIDIRRASLAGTRAGALSERFARRGALFQRDPVMRNITFRHCRATRTG